MIGRERLELLCKRSVSVLSNSRQYRRRLMIIGLLLFFTILLLLPTLFHSSDVDDEKNKSAFESVDYRDALQENLERLRQLQVQHVSENATDSDTHSHHMSKRHVSKTYEMRQHAPTRMYAIDSSKNNHSSDHNHGSFLDKSTYTQFANQTTTVPVINAVPMAHPFFTVPQGEFIHATLETAVNSDLPGMIRAVVARPVYSYRGDHLLIPEGARLIGQYSSRTLQGINRIMVIWQRVILPNGVSVQIDSPGSDALGEGGFGADEVNRHFIQRFGQASLLSLIGAVVSNTNPTDQYETAVAQSFQMSANGALNKMISIKPTLRVNQGANVIVFVARDLDFYMSLRHDSHS